MTTSGKFKIFVLKFIEKSDETRISIRKIISRNLVGFQNLKRLFPDFNQFVFLSRNISVNGFSKLIKFLQIELLKIGQFDQMGVRIKRFGVLNKFASNVPGTVFV